MSAVTWQQFAAAAPGLAATGLERLAGRPAYLATLRADGSPRVHPISPFVAEGHLVVYMEPTSPKGLDLRRDARYALHAGVEDNNGGGGEFALSGAALLRDEPEIREMVFTTARGLGYRPQERYVVFELLIGSSLSTVYPPQGDPVRRRWQAE